MNPKWQRITYMPALPLGDDGQRVTACKKHIALAREAAAEGIVLLKNDEQCLPITASQPLAVFGKAQADYVKGGGGSGDVNTLYVHSLLDTMKQEGWNLYSPLSTFYEAYVHDAYEKQICPGQVVEPSISDALLHEARAHSDTALIVLCRYSTENLDRTALPRDGDFYLSAAEEQMVQSVIHTFERVIVILNIGGMMDTSWCRNKKVKAILMAGQGGLEGGNAIADVLSGRICPSGHLTDTFAENFDAYPSSAGYHASQNYVEYNEDIFVGYRYFETIPGASEKVVYPFGYGLSYTTFSINANCFLDNDALVTQARVKNTGEHPGKEVVQVYAQAPQGKLGKAARVLIGFAKTKLLMPDEEEMLQIVSPISLLSSYDDEGVVCQSAWVLEAGSYYIYIGENVRDAKPLDFIWSLDADKIIEQLSPRCTPKHLTRRLRADGSYTKLNMAAEDEPMPYSHETLFYNMKAPAERALAGGINDWAEAQGPQLIDVAEGRMTLNSFMDSLTLEQQIHLLGGQPNRGVANTFGIGNLYRQGIPNVMTADGPAGLRLVPETGVRTTAFPCATTLACTWNEDLVERVGRAAAAEVKENGIAVWLAPGINIHRSPLCARNFEYYSEDPLLTGRMAAAMVRGVQSRGVSPCVKHFACNNKETNRFNCDSRLSERALREIYLKGFELCVKSAHPWSLMTSYNPINGIRSSENHDLLTEILRNEWGYDGVVFSDWFNYADQYKEIAAGNDIKMGRGMPDYTLEMVRQGKLGKKQVYTCAKRVLELFLKLD